MTRIKILDIPFDNFTQQQALDLVISSLKNKNSKAFFIATPNPEMLLEAQKNHEFKTVLNQTNLNIPDGIGIILASKIQKTPLLERIPGVDFMQQISKMTLGTKIFLLGAAEGVAEKTKQKLEKLFPEIKIVGTYSGSPAVDLEQKICTKITQSEAEILFVAFGAPKQELWISRNLKNLPTIKVVMGIGGAFDFIAQIRKRAPKWMQKIWLEWLYRLIQEPSRIKRIYNAILKFSFSFLLSVLKKL